LKSEFEVIAAIVDILSKLPNVNLKHIQSKSNNHENMDDKILHSMSHNLAQDVRQENPIPNSTIPQLHTSNIDLIINNHKVSSKYLEELRLAAAKPALWKYYQDKYRWNDECINNIDWTAHGHAISSLTGRQQKTTLQFIHKWLPLNASHSLQAEGTGRLCPFCHQEDEDHLHFISCLHDSVIDQWKNATETIQKKLHNYSKSIHPTLIKLLTLSITEWKTISQPPRPSFVQPQFYQLFESQSRIGWNHVLYGRLTTHWSSSQYAIDSTTPTWISYAIRQIWSQFHVIWKYGCDTNHGINKEDKRRRALLHITPKIQHLYSQQDQISPNDSQIFDTPISELILLPTQTLERWIFTASRRIKESIKRQQIYTKQHLQPIRNFFQRVIPHIPVNPRHRVINCSRTITNPTTNHNTQEPTEEQHQQNNQIQRIAPRYTTRSILNYFQTTQHESPDPVIPVPQSDYRPP
jgi:hypothetical protein